MRSRFFSSSLISSNLGENREHEHTCGQLLSGSMGVPSRVLLLAAAAQ